MKKTRLGISVGMLGAAIYFTGLLGGLFASIILVGYVLMFEENEWLKKNAVKSVILVILFALLSSIVNLIPDIITFINYVANIFGGYVNITSLSAIVNAIVTAINIVEKILFIILGVKAFNQGTVSVPIVDKLINKYME